MSTIAIPTPFSKGGLLYLTSGYVGDQIRPVFAVRLRGQGRYQLEAGGNVKPVHRLVSTHCGTVQPLAAGLRRLLLHAARPRLFTCHDAKTELPVAMCKAAHRPRGRRFYGVALGI